MTLNEYQLKAMDTCMPSCHNFTYMMNGYVGEVGELASKVAKLRRKSKLDIDNNQLILKASNDDELDEILEGLQQEIGDNLWFIAGLCSLFGWELETIGKKNIEKLASRQQRGVIDGNGDNR